MGYPVIRLDADGLDRADLRAGGPTLYEIWWDGIQFEFLIGYKKGLDRAVVFGTGDIDRSKMALPIFSRANWMDRIDAACIYYADPTLRLSDTAGLLWGYGTNDDWYLARVARLLLKILDRLGIEIRDTLFYGSSGGGFTAIALATLLGGRASAINPQLIVTNFWPGKVQALKEVCLRPGEELIPERVDLARLIRREGHLPWIHLTLNRASEQDRVQHLRPFVKSLRAYGFDTTRSLIVTEYEREGPHAHGLMPSNEECFRSIHADLAAEHTPPAEGTSFLRGLGRAPVEGHTPGDRADIRAALASMTLWRMKSFYSDAEIVDKADGILKGILYVHPGIEGWPYDLETLDWNIQWSRMSRTFQLYLQSLIPLAILARACELSKDTSYLIYGHRLLRSWRAFSRSPQAREDCPMLFYDHSVARRSDDLLYFGKVCHDADRLDDDLADLLWDILAECAGWLSDPANYTPQHNHGIMEDEALLHLGLCLRNEEWASLAKERLIAQMEHAFFPDGVHVENSPGYHSMVARMFSQIGRYLAQSGDGSSAVFADTDTRTRAYASWARMPNGLLARIGDTNTAPGRRHGTRAEMRRSAPDTHVMFPHAGVYFYRSDRDADPKDDTWKTIKAGYVSTVHKHADDGSFMLYSKGHEIFTDSGSYGYTNKDDPFRRYVVSANAHNCVVVDGASWIQRKNENMDKVGVLDWSFLPGYDRIRIFNDAYPGVRLERIFCSADDLTVLSDTARSGKAHRYTQLFHLGEDMRVLRAEDEEVLIQIGESGPMARIRQYGDPARLTVYKGDPRKPGYGLISRSMGALIPTTTLAFDVTGKEMRLVTAVTIEDKDGNVRLFDRMAAFDTLQYLPEGRALIMDGLDEPIQIGGEGAARAPSS